MVDGYMTGAPRRLLLLEEDVWLCDLYAERLTTIAGLEVLTAPNCDQAFELLNSKSFDVAVVDLLLTGNNGVEFINELATYEDTWRLPIVLISSISERETEMTPEAWRQYGVVAYVYKPRLKPADLKALVLKQLAILEAAVDLPGSANS